MADSNSRKGTAYHAPEILDWVNRIHSPHDEALSRAFETPTRLGFPPIHVGPSEGKLLGSLLRLVRAERVVEVGTLVGYSAIWIARALPPSGRLWTVESDMDHANAARTNLMEAGLLDNVGILVGQALDILPTLVRLGPFDAVFLDADKENYSAYGAWAATNLRPGGLLLADNAFYFGRLLDDEPGAAAVRRFHEETRDAFDTVVIPTPDGMLLGIRK
jgi:predicted O-methyltransferase YrrM